MLTVRQSYHLFIHASCCCEQALNKCYCEQLLNWYELVLHVLWLLSKFRSSGVREFGVQFTGLCDTVCSKISVPWGENIRSGAIYGCEFNVLCDGEIRFIPT